MQISNIKDKTNKNYEVIYNFSNITVKTFKKVKNEDVLGQLGFCPETHKPIVWQKETMEVLNLKKLNKSNKDFVFENFKNDLEKNTFDFAIKKARKRIYDFETKKNEVRIKKYNDLNKEESKEIKKKVIELRKNKKGYLKIEEIIENDFKIQISKAAIIKICKKIKRG